MKLRSRVSAVGAAVVAFGAFTATAAAAPASAASWTHLCVNIPASGGVPAYTNCADALGLENQIGVDPNAATTNWTYPMTNGGVGDIKQANVNLCMQLNSNGDSVRGATCVGDAAEEWENYYNSTTKRTEFLSIWSAEHGNTLCLSFADDPSDENDSNGGVYAMPCSNNPNNQWGSS